MTLGENAVVERTDNAAKVAVTANKAGTLYYLAQEADKAAPDAETIAKEGKAVDVVAGENTLEPVSYTHLFRCCFHRNRYDGCIRDT